jgi:hypothetical protein
MSSHNGGHNPHDWILNVGKKLLSRVGNKMYGTIKGRKKGAR